MSVQDLVAWLKKHVGDAFGLGVGETREELIEHVQLELAVVVDNYAYVTSTGTFDAPGEVEDVEQESMRRIMSVVLGSPEIAKDPVQSTSPGRLSRAHPLELVTGAGDPFDVSLRSVPVSQPECVQHLLRYYTGHCVEGF